MRIVTGTARGTHLLTPEGNAVRPTSAQVKEAVFSAVQFEIEGARVLDLFAGCGQMGLESLSRGASFVTFVDSSRASLDLVRKNAERCRFAEGFETVCSDFSLFLSRCQKQYDFCFIDPPYHDGLYDKALTGAAALMRESGIIMCEHPSDVPLKERYGSFRLAKEYRYGKIRVAKYVFEGELP